MPLPDVPVPAEVLKYEKMMKEGISGIQRRHPDTPAGLKKSATILRTKAKEIRAVATHESAMERAKAKHYLTAATKLAKAATTVKKEVAAQKKVSKAAAKMGKKKKDV